MKESWLHVQTHPIKSHEKNVDLKLRCIKTIAGALFITLISNLLSKTKSNGSQHDLR